MRRTATTAHAILGLLALRPEWTTWELRNQLRRNMRFFWPRAESRILAELKRLDQDGLAVARRETEGRRQRTIYAITPQGRERLQDWLAAPPRPTALECEPLLRTMLGSLGTRDQLLAAVAQIQADAAGLFDVADSVAAEYLAGTAPFQDEVEYRAFVFDYLATHAAGMREWAERTSAAVAAWPSLTADERRAAAIEQIADRHAAVRDWPRRSLEGTPG